MSTHLLRSSQALNFLHAGGGGDRCFHRDVKSANICLTASLEPKLIDCGLARFIPEGDDRIAVTATNNSQPGTMGYKCPRYEGGEKFSAASEVFSFGVVLLELVVGDVTLVGRRKTNLFFHFIDDEDEALSDAFDERAEGDGAWPATMKDGLESLINGCLESKPKKRISLMPVLRQLRELEREHCQVTQSEEMLKAMREELEKALAIKQMEEAQEKIAAKYTCKICFDEEFTKNEGVLCKDQHYLCLGCFGGHVGNTATREDRLKRGSKVCCPVPDCKHAYSQQDVAKLAAEQVRMIKNVEYLPNC